MSEPVATSRYDAAAVHLRTADDRNRTSHDSALDLQRAQVNALLAIVDELRLLRASVNELAKDVSSGVSGLDQEHASLRHIANPMNDIAERPQH
jgi:hypothetical protein